MNLTATTVRRRPYLIAPGEGLILTVDLLSFSERQQKFLEDADLGATDLIASPVVSIPIPKAALGSDGELLRWEGADPAMMWHPLFWLPRQIALRLQVADSADDSLRVETDEEWLLRVSMQVVEVGLFDIETGTWLDVLSRYGLDADDPEVQSRIDAWNAGGADPILDQIDLSALFDEVGPDSDMVKSILADTHIYVKAQGALTAGFLLDAVEDIREDLELQEATTPEEATSAATMFAITAHVGFLGTNTLGATSYLTETAQVFEYLQGGGDLQAALTRLVDIGERARTDFQPALDSIVADADQLEREAAEVSRA